MSEEQNQKPVNADESCDCVDWGATRHLDTCPANKKVEGLIDRPEDPSLQGPWDLMAMLVRNSDKHSWDKPFRSPFPGLKWELTFEENNDELATVRVYHNGQAEWRDYRVVDMGDHLTIAPEFLVRHHRSGIGQLPIMSDTEFLTGKP